jgi:CBS domain-containing protein
MTTPAPAVQADLPLPVAVELLLEYGYPALPVVDDDGQLIGIVGDGDVILHRLDRRRCGGSTVADAMTTQVLAVPRQLELEELSRRLVSGGHPLLPVVEDRRLVGVVTRRELLRQWQVRKD